MATQQKHQLINSAVSFTKRIRQQQ